jgi:two-component system OmpR family sensor kinase
MFRTLYSKLALTLFVMLCVVGVVLIQVIGQSSKLYQQEVAQKLNRDLAMYIVREHALFQDNGINQAALDELFHQLMVINPSIEVYLLDSQGNIISYNAPQGAVKRDRVALEPVRAYLAGKARFPLRGDDPRSREGRKVFSVAAVPGPGGVRGYLYVVLGSEQYEHIAGMPGNSYILDSALVVLLIALVAALGGGLLAFAVLTRRLRQLSEIMRRYAGEQSAGSAALRYPGRSDDEIGVLGQQFNTMADRISAQLDTLKRMDGVRREMVANISHDLRTPLTTMRGYLETLVMQHDTLDSAQQQEYQQIALGHSQRMAGMVEELFELARLDSCESVVYAEPFSICELVQDVSQNFRLRAQEKSVMLDVNLDPGTPPVYGDIGMMQRVLENLLENGLRHTPTGGHIRIGVDVDSGNVVVQVADTGCGIAAEDVPHIFERFYQRDRYQSGGENAGLGLAIVRRILELHGSVIQVSSRIGQGTIFSFRLPAQEITA